MLHPPLSGPGLHLRVSGVRPSLSCSRSADWGPPFACRFQAEYYLLPITTGFRAHMRQKFFVLGLGRLVGGTTEPCGFPRNRSPQRRVARWVPGRRAAVGTCQSPRLGPIPRRSLIVCGARNELQTGPKQKKAKASLRSERPSIGLAPSFC